MPLKTDVQRAKQAQGIHMAVERTEARTDDIRPDLRQHLLRLGMIEHVIFEPYHSRLVMQAFERIGAIFHLPLREKQVKAAGLMQANVEASLDSQRFGELGPSIRRLPRPNRISGHAATLTLHPDQGKIP